MDVPPDRMNKPADARCLSLWPLIYLTGPLFIPFISYEFSVTHEPTVFARHPWAFNLCYALVVAAIAALITRRQTAGWSLFFWFLTVVAASILTHFVLNLRGYYFWMDTP